MKKLANLIALLFITFIGSSCVEGSSSIDSSSNSFLSSSNLEESASSYDQENSSFTSSMGEDGSSLSDEISSSGDSEDSEVSNMKVRISVGEASLIAEFEDNPTSNALVEAMPFTIYMSDLYSREMCYRYGYGAFPTGELRDDGYQIGDIAYWPPRGSLVILYAQNGEEFSRQHIGHIDEGVEIFASTGSIDVRFELAD